MTGYKKIVTNIVEREVRNWIENRVDKYVGYPDKILMFHADKYFDYPTFNVALSVDGRSYTFHGYIDDYAIVHITSIHFERDRVIDQDRDDWYAKDNIRHEEHSIVGSELEKFQFDR